MRKYSRIQTSRSRACSEIHRTCIERNLFSSLCHIWILIRLRFSMAASHLPPVDHVSFRFCSSLLHGNQCIVGDEHTHGHERVCVRLCVCVVRVRGDLCECGLCSRWLSYASCSAFTTYVCYIRHVRECQAVSYAYIARNNDPNKWARKHITAYCIPYIHFYDMKTFDMNYKRNINNNNTEWTEREETNNKTSAPSPNGMGNKIF